MPITLITMVTIFAKSLVGCNLFLLCVCNHAHSTYLTKGSYSQFAMSEES